MTLAARASGEEYRAHAGGLADANGAHVGFHELHGVVDRKTRAHHSAWRIYVERDVLLGILGLEEQHLCDHDVCHIVIDRADDEDDALLEEARIDVIRPLATRGLLDDDGH